MADKAIPNQSAVRGAIRPAGNGRFLVRAIHLSDSRSIYMFRVFAPDTTSTVPITARVRTPRGRDMPVVWLASQIPPSMVATTMPVMRGLVSVIRSAVLLGLLLVSRRGARVTGATSTTDPT